MLLVVPFNSFETWAAERQTEKKSPAWVNEEPLLEQIKGSVSMQVGPNTCWVTLNDKGELYIKCRHPFPNQTRYSARIESVRISQTGAEYGIYYEMVDPDFADKPIISENKLELIPIFEPYFKNLPENFKTAFRGEFGIGVKESAKQKPVPPDNPVPAWRKVSSENGKVTGFQLELAPDQWCTIFPTKEGLLILASSGKGLAQRDSPNTITYWSQQMIVRKGVLLEKTPAMLCEETNRSMPIKTDGRIEYVLARTVRKTGVMDNKVNIFQAQFAKHSNSLPAEIRAEFAGLYGIQKPGHIH